VVRNTGQGSAFFCMNGGNYVFDGLSVETTSPMPGDGGHGFFFGPASSCILNTISFGPQSPQGFHMIAGYGCSFINGGPDEIYGAGGLGHQCAFANGILANNDPARPALTIDSPMTFNQAFIVAYNGGQLNGVWGTINNYGYVHGYKFSALTNG